MGQYHILVNFDKLERVEPHKIGLGSKQVEHAWTVASLPDVLYMLLTASLARGGGDLDTRGETEDFKVFGRWCGDRVVVLGDYTEDDDIPEIEDLSSYFEDEATTDITDDIIPAFEKAFSVSIDTTSTGWRKRELGSAWDWLFETEDDPESLSQWQSGMLTLLTLAEHELHPQPGRTAIDFETIKTAIKYVRGLSDNKNMSAVSKFCETLLAPAAETESTQAE